VNLYHSVSFHPIILSKAAGIAAPSYTHDLLEDKEPDEVEDHEIKWSAASMYSGESSSLYSACVNEDPTYPQVVLIPCVIRWLMRIILMFSVTDRCCDLCLLLGYGSSS
jgi:hypothetical protein